MKALLAVAAYVTGFYVAGFTGIDQAYEPPSNPEFVAKTAEFSVDETIKQLVIVLQDRDIVANNTVDVVRELFVPPEYVSAALEEAAKLPKLAISKLDLQWIQVLAEGWATPLLGFMREVEYLQAQHFNCLINGRQVNQSIPIVLPVHQSDYEKLSNQSAIVLMFENKPIAILRNPEFFEHRKEERVARTFGTTQPDHPYIKVSHCSGLSAVFLKLAWFLDDHGKR